MSGESHRPQRQARPRYARLGVIVAGAFVCMLAANSASAWVPTPNRPKPSHPAKSTARYVPARSHADPASREVPLAAILTGGRPAGSGAWMQARATSTAFDAATQLSALSHWSCRGAPRAVTTLPSHWGATHLSV
jgi:hypothetical protein